MNRATSYQLEPYVPPDWASQLKLVPSYRIRVAQTPTPIRPWHPGELPEGYSAWIKRDDRTGIALSGNKARKLEFLLADAIASGCDTVITCGGIQSNHARATAVAAREQSAERQERRRRGDTAARAAPCPEHADPQGHPVACVRRSARPQRPGSSRSSQRLIGYTRADRQGGSTNDPPSWPSSVDIRPGGPR